MPVVWPRRLKQNMKKAFPSWGYRALIGIGAVLGAFVFLAYKVLTSGISVWDKTGIILIQILCVLGLICLFSQEYEKYKGNLKENKKLHIAIGIPLAVLGLISAYLIILPFFKGISLENNSPSVFVAKIIVFAAIAVVGVVGIFQPRK